MALVSLQHVIYQFSWKCWTKQWRWQPGLVLSDIHIISYRYCSATSLAQLTLYKLKCTKAKSFLYVQQHNQRTPLNVWRGRWQTQPNMFCLTALSSIYLATKLPTPCAIIWHCLCGLRFSRFGRTMTCDTQTDRQTDYTTTVHTTLAC